ncbi:MAG: ATP synthase subunit I [Pseudomonadota bacterium]
MEWKIVYKNLSRLNWATLFLLSLLSYFFMNHSLTLGIILGGLVMIANFGLFQHTIRRAFAADGAMKAKRISVIVKYYLRLSALGVIIYALISFNGIDPIGLAIGFSTVVISIIIFGVRRALKTSFSEAT